MDGLSEYGLNASIFNDDQLAKNLDRLFKADRNPPMAELSANTIVVYHLETKQIYNDSTSITFLGEYKNENFIAVKLRHRLSKDHRPDCKQIIFGLNITADGNVPLSFELFDGNRTDDTTHIPNWNALHDFMVKEDFIYIADCNLCSEKNLNHIHEHNRTFITIHRQIGPGITATTFIKYSSKPDRETEQKHSNNPKGVTNVHGLVLKLLGFSPSVYITIIDQWWIFTNALTPQSEGST